MLNGRSSLPGRRWALLAVVALLGLAVASVTATAGASGGRHKAEATMAKKKCKRKHKRSAAAAKKKAKCRKVKHVVLPAPGPLTRATLAWTANDEVDLHAFDANGNHAGWVDPTGVVNNIPNAHHAGDVGPGGPSESFVDDVFVVGGPSNREFGYVACLYDGPDPDPYTATFTGVARDGTSSTVPLDGPGVVKLTIPGGPSISDSQAASACGLF